VHNINSHHHGDKLFLCFIHNFEASVNIIHSSCLCPALVLSSFHQTCCSLLYYRFHVYEEQITICFICIHTHTHTHTNTHKHTHIHTHKHTHPTHTHTHTTHTHTHIHTHTYTHPHTHTHTNTRGGYVLEGPAQVKFCAIWI